MGYQTNKIESLDTSSLNPKADGNQSILEFVRSTSNLSPRGQANCFGGYHSASGIFNTSSPETDSKYDIYIWNGIEASQFTRANCLTKVFILDGALKEGKCLDILAYTNSTLIPITSLFSFDNSSKHYSWEGILKSNHLLRTINQSYQFVHIENHKKVQRLESSSTSAIKNHHKKHREPK